MIKYCKSCGKEYSGKWCEHCGYGKPDLVTHAADKYKKEKPERFMTDEEKTERSKRLAEKREAEKKLDSEKQSKSRAAQKRKSQWAFIIIALVVFAAVAVFALWQNGIIFKGADKTEVITTYFNAIAGGDFDGYTSTMVEPMAKGYEEELEKQGLSKSEFMKKSYEDYEKGFGEGYTVSVSFGNEEKMSGEEISDSENILKSAYGKSYSIKEAYKVATNVTYTGTLTEETVDYYVYVGKIGSRWYILNIDG